MGCILLSKPLYLSSVLYNIEPVGLETTLVESLSSYLIRVAYEHNITVGNLINKIVIPEMNKAYLDRSTVYGGNSFYEGAKTINGYMNYSTELVRVMGILTTRKDLSNLTLFKLKDFIPLRNLFKVSLSWCPNCIRDWYGSGKTIYYPLIWYLKSIKICTRHKCFLLDKCPNCNKKIDILRRQMILGYCPNCSSLLAQPFSTEEMDIQELYWYNFNYQNISSLISANFNKLSIKQSKYNINKQLNILNQELFLGNISNFSELCGVPKSTLRCWLKGENTPSLDKLLLICYRLNIEILDLLLGKRKIDIDISKINKSMSINKYKTERKPFNFDLIEKKLNEFLLYDIPISMTAVAREIGKDKRILYRNFPDYCKCISERYKNYLVEKSNERIQLLKNEINIAFNLLIDEKVYPSSGKIEEKINKKGLLREKVLQDFWRKMLIEKGFVK